MFHLIRKMATFVQPKLNRLKLEKSPYLLQHATNPVDWYPWGEDAFKEAKNANKVIFLSVGYSTCHWCHVMEKESFENVDTAKIMNDNFINIKVDREERPDVDKVYMSFITQLTGSGGWPMSVWLTPDLKPFYGGTYYPPDDRYRGIQPSFTSVLNSVAAKWEENPSLLKHYGSKILDGLKQNSSIAPESGQCEAPHVDAIINCCAMQLARSYEPTYGGFSDSPKFPQPSNLNFIFAYNAMYSDRQQKEAQAVFKMAVHTLLMMGKGGIHDHVAQGFARYSTDKEWQIPHFEKMLFDQAQLVHAYLDGYLATRRTCFADLAKDILTYVTRDLSHPEGGFYSAEDADSLPSEDSLEKVEGAFCVWEYEEVRKLLQENIENTQVTLADIFCHHFSVCEGGNVDPEKDHHDNFKKKNVLIIRGSFEETAQQFSIDEHTCKCALNKACEILRAARRKRPPPHLDDKMLTAWNGMMLSAIARAGAVFGQNEYVQRAIQNVNFIKKYLYKEDQLIRTVYKCGNGGVSMGSEIGAFSDDYAWLIRGLIELYFATLDCQWLRWAEILQEKQKELFWDEENGGFFLSKQSDCRILLRLKEGNDTAEPSVNSVSAGNLVKLSRLLNRADFYQQAGVIFTFFSQQLNKIPVSLPEMVLSYMMYANQAEQIILSGNKDSAEMKQMLTAVHSSALNPNRIILHADSSDDSLLYNKHQNLIRYKPKKEGKVAAYVCRDFACSLPAKSVEELTKTMKKNVRIG